MTPHPIDPVALIAGLLFALSGLAIIAEQQWEDIDVTAFTAAGVVVIGLLLVAATLVRYLRDDAQRSGPVHPDPVVDAEPEEE